MPSREPTFVEESEPNRGRQFPRFDVRIDGVLLDAEFRNVLGKGLANVEGRCPAARDPRKASVWSLGTAIAVLKS